MGAATATTIERNTEQIHAMMSATSRCEALCCPWSVGRVRRSVPPLPAPRPLTSTRAACCWVPTPRRATRHRNAHHRIAYSENGLKQNGLSQNGIGSSSELVLVDLSARHSLASMGRSSRRKTIRATSPQASAKYKTHTSELWDIIGCHH